MTITYGLTALGFVPKPQDVCRSEIGASLRAKRGASIDLTDGSLLGQMVGIFSEREASLWDLGQADYSALDPDATAGAALEAVCALTGTFRGAARKSVVIETLTGTPGTIVTGGAQINTVSTNAAFATAASATIATLAAWATGHAYVLGDRVTNSSRAYQCITAGTSAGSGGPTTTALDITDNTAHWYYLGEGTGAVDVLTKSVLADAIVAVSGDLTNKQTPVGGWQSATNLFDATVGAPVQTDAQLRLTRLEELSASGNSPADAIRAALLVITGVFACTVFVNDTDVTDGNGQPPHSVQALVQGGDDTAIANVLSQNVAAGIKTYGTTTVSVDDSQGTPHDWKFTRPAAVPIWIDITLTYNPAMPAQGGYPADGDTQVIAALVNYGNSLSAGRDSVAAALGSKAFLVQGVLDVPRSGSLGGTLIKTSASPTADTTITITPFQIATYDTSHVTVHSSAGSV